MRRIGKKAKAWWKLGQPVWITLLLGWVWVMISMAAWFEIAASGAVLVCAAVIADLKFQQLKWRKSISPIWGPVKPSGVVEGQMSYKAEWGTPVRYMLGLSNQGPIHALRDLANDREVSAETDTWSVRETGDRVDKVLVRAIAVSAIIGTLIWGYTEFVVKKGIPWFDALL